MDEALLKDGQGLGKAAGWLNLAEVPLSDAEWAASSFRERLRVSSLKYMYENGVLPVPTVTATYVAILGVWWAGFRYVFMDPSQSLFAELNIKRFLVYQVLHGLLGLGATSSLLGFRFVYHVGGVAIHFLTPGTVCSPLIPQLAHALNCGRGVPGQRSILAVLSFSLYLAALLAALLAPAMGAAQLIPIYCTLALCTVFDFTIYNASRGEHYVYMMLCLLFPDWRSGMQCVQLALWAWAGVSKMGPWFQYVIPFITKDCLVMNLLPRGILAKLLLKDYPRDLNPSTLTTVLAWTGASLELVFPGCCASTSLLLRCFGAYGMICYHAFIGICMPFASVFEWNVFCMILAYYLFILHEFSLPTTPLLQCFLALVLLVIPVIGQLYPTLVPFLLAFRPYAGNWRMQWYLVHKSALSKHRKLKTCEDPFENNLGWMYQTFFGKWGEASKSTAMRFGYVQTAAMLYVPAYRPLVSIMEKLCEENGWKTDDVLFCHSESYQNQVFGWSLGTGWIAARECTREAFNAICSFQKGEMYFVQFEPCQPLPRGKEHHIVKFRCFDVTEGPENAQIHGAVPYADLAASQPTDLRLTSSQCQRGKSIKGMFLSTYY